MNFALEIFLTMTFGAGAGFLACAMFASGGRADDAVEIARLREENARLLGFLAVAAGQGLPPTGILVPRAKDFPPEAFV